ncbi:MAG TPA: XRE family transcriptional regulator, partial [Bacteroidales bacterium]|nr:XRE family transcriptional regulator [Bacteroidales bacterium]
MNEVDLRKRIEAVIKNEQLTAAKFAEILGVQRSSISHILSGRNNPSLDFIVRMTEKFEYLNLEWLIFGIGEMVKETEKKKTRQNDSMRDLFHSPVNAIKTPGKILEAAMV